MWFSWLLIFLWLGVVARRFYLNHLGRFFAEQVNWAAAFVFYLLFLAGMMIFAVQPALEHNSLSRALALGALYGLFTYATYDLTNLATLKEWPVPIVVVDILWGHDSERPGFRYGIPRRHAAFLIRT